MINWEQSQGHEGLLQTVCFDHHSFFMSNGGGGKVWPSIGGEGKVGPLQIPVPNIPLCNRCDESDNVLFSGDGLNLDSDASMEGGGNNEGDVAKGEDDFGISEFTTEQFEVNERCSYFMNRVPIASDNHAAVEAVYMIEAIMLVRSGNTLRKWIRQSK